MEATQTAATPSFETVWAVLQEVGEKQKEIAEQQKETDRLMRENAERQEERLKEIDRVMKENASDFNRRLGAYINLFGEVTEYMLAQKLCEKFTEFGLDFPRANPNVYVNDKVNKIYLEIDVMLENGDKAMLVEVKTKLTTERINNHINRLEKMRVYADLHGDKRVFLGALAGIVVTDEARRYALDQGFYLIEPSGENLNITPPNDKPVEW